MQHGQDGPSRQLVQSEVENARNEKTGAKMCPVAKPVVSCANRWVERSQTQERRTNTGPCSPGETKKKPQTMDQDGCKEMAGPPNKKQQPLDNTKSEILSGGMPPLVVSAATRQKVQQETSDTITTPMATGTEATQPGEVMKREEQQKEDFDDIPVKLDHDQNKDCMDHDQKLPIEKGGMIMELDERKMMAGLPIKKEQPLDKTKSEILSGGMPPLVVSAATRQKVQQETSDTNTTPMAIGTEITQPGEAMKAEEQQKEEMGRPNRQIDMKEHAEAELAKTQRTSGRTNPPDREVATRQVVQQESQEGTSNATKTGRKETCEKSKKVNQRKEKVRWALGMLLAILAGLTFSDLVRIPSGGNLEVGSVTGIADEGQCSGKLDPNPLQTSVQESASERASSSPTYEDRALLLLVEGNTDRAWLFPLLYLIYLGCRPAFEPNDYDDLRELLANDGHNIVAVRGKDQFAIFRELHPNQRYIIICDGDMIFLHPNNDPAGPKDIIRAHKTHNARTAEAWKKVPIGALKGIKPKDFPQKNRPRADWQQNIGDSVRQLIPDDPLGKHYNCFEEQGVLPLNTPDGTPDETTWMLVKRFVKNIKGAKQRKCAILRLSEEDRLNCVKLLIQIECYKQGLLSTEARKALEDQFGGRVPDVGGIVSKILNFLLHSLSIKQIKEA